MKEKAVYEFTTDWFNEQIKSNFIDVFQIITPSKVLEIGSFEGASTCYLLEQLAATAPLEVHCIDTWLGSVEYTDQSFDDTSNIDMSSVEERFRENTQFALQRTHPQSSLIVHKGRSCDMLAKLIAEKQVFDFVYIDGSHQAPDVLCDAVMAFQILKVGGIIGFDDYLWFERAGNGKDVLRSPKIAIDAFTNIYAGKLDFLRSRSDQVYVRRIV
jgi:predicted O-methyltransferase YrrM